MIKGDLRIQSGPKHILEALHPDANDAFNSSREVIHKYLKIKAGLTVLDNVKNNCRAKC